jgi:hypothetical protein
MLQTAGANVTIMGDKGAGLWIAFEMLLDKDEFEKVVEMLLQMPGFDCNIYSGILRNAMAGNRERLSEKYVNAMRLLIQSGADITFNVSGCTMLMFAADSGHPEIVQLLLESLKSIKPSSSTSVAYSAGYQPGVSESSDFADPQLVKNILETRNFQGDTVFTIVQRRCHDEKVSTEKRNNYRRIYDMLLAVSTRLEAFPKVEVILQ